MTANTWPDPARPGVPMNPEQDGWHWLKRISNGWETLAKWDNDWNGNDDFWWNLPGYSDPERVAKSFYYLGPVLLPDEAAALQKRCEEADRTALQAAECHAREMRRADALQKRVAELEAQNEMLRHATDKLRAMLTELNARHEPLQRAFITAVELLNDVALAGGKDE